MKRLLFGLSALCTCVIGSAFGALQTVNWKVGNTTYDTTTCTVGGDISLPNAPRKSGYTFVGWVNGTPIEYIQSSGTQFIKSGMLVGAYSNKLQVEIDFMPLQKQDAIIGGVRDHIILITSGGGFSISGQSIGNITYDINNRYVIRMGDGVLTLNGQSIGANTFNSYGSCQYWFFNAGGNGGDCNNRMNTTASATIRLYSVKMWDGATGTLVADFIPIKDSKGVVCLYEKISDTFIYNAGTGTFTAGPDL